MKKSTIVSMLFVGSIAMPACSQDKVPSEIAKNFKERFNTAKNVQWDKENDKEWEAEFKMDGKNYSANFDLDGNWKETEYEIKKSEIPAEVKKVLDEKYADYKLEESEISETAEGKVYEFGLEKNDKEMEVAIDVSGKIIRAGDKDDEYEEDDDN